MKNTGWREAVIGRSFRMADSRQGDSRMQYIQQIEDGAATRTEKNRTLTFRLELT